MFPRELLSSKLTWCFKHFEHRVFSTTVKKILAKRYSEHFLSPCIHDVQFFLNISNSSVTNAIHTIKGWKKMVLLEEKEPPKPELVPISCEEGREAVPHLFIMSELQKCNSVSSQLETLCSTAALTSEDIQRRKEFVQSLHDLFKIYFSQCETILFGSSLNGLGFRGCDADVCLKANFTNQEALMLKEIPTLDAVLDGTISQNTLSRMNPPYLLRFVRRILRRHSTDIKEPIMFIKARCPILRFYSSKYDVFCDFSSESCYSVQNTRLLRFLCHLDDRFKTVSKIIRYWGKQGGFVGDIEMFNSYSSSLLATYFFQKTNPPIFPSIEEMYSKSEYLNQRLIENDDIMFEDLKKFDTSMNKQTSVELLRDFFFYFLNYDFSHVMQPRTASSVPKANYGPIKSSVNTFEFASVNVEDPFRPSCNATSGASFKSAKRFLNGIIHSCQMFQDHISWIPKEEAWGICNLFVPPLSELTITKQWQDGVHHTIEIAPKVDLEMKLRLILEHGLMFVCKESKQISDSELFRLTCTALHNTWQGRDQILEDMKLVNGLEALELERSISAELIKTKACDRKMLLCKFDVVCREVAMKADKKMELVFDFEESKFPPIVAVFLKDFIPKILNKI